MKAKLEAVGIAILLVILAVLCADGAPPGVMRTSVTLAWDYPTNQLSTNLTFRIFSTTNITQSVTNWPLYGATSGTNLSATFPIDANQRWFVMTASNWWGSSDFSTVAATPPLPRSDVSLSLGP